MRPYNHPPGDKGVGERGKRGQDDQTGPSSVQCCYGPKPVQCCQRLGRAQSKCLISLDRHGSKVQFRQLANLDRIWSKFAKHWTDTGPLLSNTGPRHGPLRRDWTGTGPMLPNAGPNPAQFWQTLGRSSHKVNKNGPKPAQCWHETGPVLVRLDRHRPLPNTEPPHPMFGAPAWSLKQCARRHHGFTRQTSRGQPPAAAACDKGCDNDHEIEIFASHLSFGCPRRGGSRGSV